MFHLSRGCWISLLGIVIASGGATVRAASDLPTPASIAQELNTFQSMGTVLHIAAHPDDENTQLITYLSRGRSYRTGYLSITRGDGGQNELGPDFDEKLGVARTQELLAARRLDGGQQFFTRAIDFGFSKTPEETLQFWNHDEVLSDVVRVIRQFQPDVIVTRFPIPPGSGGHGHHTASAMLAVEAFKLAGDPKAFPEQLAQGLTVWQAKRVMWNMGNSRSTGGLNGPTVTMDIGGMDPVTNEAFGTIANRSRGMHKTQGFSGISNRASGGPNVQTFMLLAGEPATKDIMDGVDTTWNREPGGAEIIRLIGKAKSKFRADDPSEMVPALLDVRTKLLALPSDPLIVAKRKQLDHLLQVCLGLHVESTVDHAEIVPGESFKLHYAITLDASNVAVRRIAVRCAALSKIDLGEPAVMDLVGGTAVTGDFTATLRPDALLTQPYWLRQDWTAGVFRVDDPALIGRPESPASVTLEHVFEINKQQMVISDEPVQVIQDAQGEHDRQVDVISPVSLRFDSEVSLFKPGEKRQIVVELNAARADLHGTVHLEIPADWKVEPASRKFHLNAVGEKASYGFMVTAPAQSASVRFTAVAEIGGKIYANRRQEIQYAHIPLQLLQPPARTHAVSFDLATRGHRIGYLTGAGDSVASCLEQMGYSVKNMTADDLTPERLPIFDAVVIGVRAFNERPDLASHFSDLLTYVQNGGTVVAQYNRPNNLKTTTLAPYPLSIEGPAPQLRVTDEKSPVTFLAANNPALTTPNKITTADFENWVQERGAYFPSSWDEAHFDSLLAFNDPGETPLKSGILVAKYGKGYYAYTSLAFFRQLPAGVPGAYRLFANLVSLGNNEPRRQ